MFSSSKVSSNYFIAFSLQNQWSKNGNEPGNHGEHEKAKPDLKLEFQFEKVKKLEGELATEQQRLKVINLTTEQWAVTQHWTGQYCYPQYN